MTTDHSINCKEYNNRVFPFLTSTMSIRPKSTSFPFAVLKTSVKYVLFYGCYYRYITIYNNMTH